MTQIEIELVTQQADSLDVEVTITHYDVNRFSITISNRIYTDLHKALSAITTKFLKNKKA